MMKIRFCTIFLLQWTGSAYLSLGFLRPETKFCSGNVRGEWSSSQNRRNPALDGTSTIQEIDPQILKISQAMIDFCGTGEWQKSLALLKAVRKKRMVPTSEAYSAIIAACQRSGQSGRAHAVFRDWETSFKTDPVTPYAAQSITEESASSLARALAVVKSMNNNNVEPSAETLALLFGHCVQTKEWELALQLFSWSQKQNIEVDESALSKLIELLYISDKQELAAILYGILTSEGMIQHPLDAKEYYLDLSRVSPSVAKCILDVVISDINSSEETHGREIVDVKKALKIQLSSTSGDEIQPAPEIEKEIKQFLDEEKGIKITSSKKNPGYIEIKAVSLKKLVKPSKQ